MRRLAIACALFAAAGCYNPDVDSGLFCDEDGNCPDGQSCGADNVCRDEDDDDIDASVTPDIDAGTGTIDATPGIDAEVFPACGEPITCPVPDPTRVTICGQLLDLTTSLVLSDAQTGEPCGPAGGVQSGDPCSLTVEFFDPLQFLSNPETEPLAVDDIRIDDCGRFRGVNVNRPATGFITVVTKDRVDGSDVFVRTARTVTASGGETIDDFNAYALTRAQDQLWTNTAGNPFGGPTFSEVGVTMGVFLHAGNPRFGVTFVRSGAAAPADDFYFNSGMPFDWSSIDPTIDNTGEPGAALLVNSSLVEHTGLGGEPAGCEWSTSLSASVAGIVNVTLFEAVVAGDPSKPCPPP